MFGTSRRAEWSCFEVTHGRRDREEHPIRSDPAAAKTNDAIDPIRHTHTRGLTTSVMQGGRGDAGAAVLRTATFCFLLLAFVVPHGAKLHSVEGGKQITSHASALRRLGVCVSTVCGPGARIAGWWRSARIPSRMLRDARCLAVVTAENLQIGMY